MVQREQGALVSPKIKKAGRRPPSSKTLNPPTEVSTRVERAALHPGSSKSYFFALAFFAFFALAFFAFLAIVSSQGFNGLKRDSEACIVAEGQPRNILATISNRFAAYCRLLSPRCHHVIHSCYAFLDAFFEIFMRRRPQRTFHGAIQQRKARPCMKVRYRSASANFAPSAAKPAAKLRRSQAITFGRLMTWSRTEAANRP